MIKHIKKIILLIGLFLTVAHLNAQTDSLKTKIEDILKTKNARVGVSIVANDGKDTLKINDSYHYPMQSVFKFPIALTVLSEIDKGILSLD